MSEIIIYSTFPSHENAQDVSKALLEARLVACANIFQPHASLYWWEGEVEESDEIAVIFKTSSDLFEKVEQKIQALHPYDVPCIVSLPIERGHEAFLNWIQDQTA